MGRMSVCSIQNVRKGNVIVFLHLGRIQLPAPVKFHGQSDAALNASERASHSPRSTNDTSDPEGHFRIESVDLTMFLHEWKPRCIYF